MTVLFRNAQIVSMDRAIGDLACGDVLVSDEEIAAVGVNLDAPSDAEIVDASGLIMIPGMVNAHLHLWQTVLRGIAADWTVPTYMRSMHAGLATIFRPDDIFGANLVGALNQIDCGTTTVVDWCHNNPTPEHTEAAIAGLEQSGIRGLFLHGSPKPDPAAGQKHFSEVPMPRDEVERLRTGKFSSDDRLLRFGLAILGPAYSIYDVTRQDMTLAKELDLIASMHVGGGPMRVPDGFERLADDGLMIEDANIVHGNNLSGGTLDLILDHGGSVTVTVETELQMGFGDPLTGPLRARGAPISIGPDIESAVGGDMFSVMRLTMQAQRNLDNIAALRDRGDVGAEASITCREALGWATIDGAKMARLDGRVGSLTPGKKADIVLLSKRLNMFPLDDPASAIVLHAGPANVHSVMINGRFRKRDHGLIHHGLDAVLDDLAQSRERILGEFKTRLSQ